VIYNNPTRKDDERVLAWLQMRDDGQTPSQIAMAEGVTKNAVIGATNRVYQAEAKA